MKVKQRIAAAFAAAVVGGAALAGLTATTTAVASAETGCVNQVTAAGHKVFPQQPCVRAGHKHNGHHRR